MDAEIKEYIRHLSDRKDIYWKAFKFYTGKINNKKVVVVKSGVGKVFAAMICQKLIDKFNIDKILFTGVAGSLNKKLNILDVVVAEDCVQHDMDAIALGFKRGQIPYTKYRIFKSSEELKKIALRTTLDGNKKIIKGRILTGDQFFSGIGRLKHGYLKRELGGMAIEMEGASVAQVCTVNRIPFLIIRSISDKADGKAADNFNSFLKSSAKNSFKVVSHILNNI